MSKLTFIALTLQAFVIIRFVPDFRSSLLIMLGTSVCMVFAWYEGTKEGNKG